MKIYKELIEKAIPRAAKKVASTLEERLSEWREQNEFAYKIANVFWQSELVAKTEL